MEPFSWGRMQYTEITMGAYARNNLKIIYMYVLYGLGTYHTLYA